MVKRFCVLVAVLVLAGCQSSSHGGRTPHVKPGQSITYQALLTEKIRAFVEDQRSNPAPEVRENAFATCAASAIMADLKPPQVNRLNAYARGETKISQPELDRMGVEPRSRYRDLTAMIEQLRYVCPSEIAGARPYWLLR